jgi:hypothetical protein
MGRYLDLANLTRAGHETSSPGDPGPVRVPTPETTAAVSSSPLDAPEVIHVNYQRIFYDWDLADGIYTPEQLRKAKMGVKPRGPVQSYTLTSRGAVESPNGEDQRRDRGRDHQGPSRRHATESGPGGDQTAGHRVAAAREGLATAAIAGAAADRARRRWAPQAANRSISSGTCRSPNAPETTRLPGIVKKD